MLGMQTATASIGDSMELLALKSENRSAMWPSYHIPVNSPKGNEINILKSCPYSHI